MSDPFHLEPLDATFGAVVTGPRLPDLDPSAFAALHAHWLDRALLIFPGQFLTKDEQVAFAERFGPLEFAWAPISNVRADGSVRADQPDDEMLKIIKGNMEWHCDSTYMPVQAKGAVFSAQVVAVSGGETGFADMRAAYDALDGDLRARVERMGAFHSLRYSQGRAGLAPKADGGDYSGYGFDVADAPFRPLVKTHPETHRKTLMIGRHAYGVPGLSAEDSARFLDELCDFACRPPRVYDHRWSAGDVVVWDNRSLMHRACPWDMREPRVMHHTRLAGDPVTEFAVAA